MTSHGDFFDVLIFSADEEIVKISIKRIEESMETAKKIGAKKVVFHTNYNSQIKTDFYLNNWLDRNYEVFSCLCNRYKDITILMENMFDYDYIPIKRLAERMKDIDNFGICLDYAHATIFGKNIEYWDGKIDWSEFNKLRVGYFANTTILIEVNGIDKITKSINYMKSAGLFD